MQCFSQRKVYTNKLFVTETTGLMQTYTSQELREVKLLGIIYYDTNIIISTLFTFYSNIKMFHVSQQLTVVLKLSARSYQSYKNCTVINPLKRVYWFIQTSRKTPTFWPSQADILFILTKFPNDLVKIVDSFINSIFLGQSFFFWITL